MMPLLLPLKVSPSYSLILLKLDHSFQIGLGILMILKELQILNTGNSLPKPVHSLFKSNLMLPFKLVLQLLEEFGKNLNSDQVLDTLTPVLLKMVKMILQDVQLFNPLLQEEYYKNLESPNMEALKVRFR